MKLCGKKYQANSAALPVNTKKKQLKNGDKGKRFKNFMDCLSKSKGGIDDIDFVLSERVFIDVAKVIEARAIKKVAYR